MTAGLPRFAAGSRHAATLAALVLCVALAVAGSYAIERHHALRLAALEHSAENVARVGVAALAQQVERTLEAVSMLHILGAMLHAEKGRPEVAQEDVRRLEAHLVEIATERRFAAMQVALIDRDGQLDWSTVPGFRRVDLSDREHFRRYRDGLRDPFVSAPLQGRVSRQWTVQFTRPLLEADGSFGGVVVASLDPLDISREFAALRLAPRAVATLIREDGTVLARSSDASSYLAARLAPENMAKLSQLLAASGGEHVTYVMPSFTGVPLLFAVARIEGWPLVIALGIDTRLELGRAAGRRREFQAALAVGLVLLLGLGTLVDSARARAAAHAVARQSEASRQEMLDLLESLPGATYRGSLDARGDWIRFQTSSERGRLLQGQPGARHGQGSTVHDGARLAEERQGFRAQLLAEGEVVSEYPVQRPDGTTAWLRDQCRRVDASNPDAVEVVGILSDITEERQVKAKAIAASKLATLGEMATGVAHELSQPCSAIGLAADVGLLLLERPGPETAGRVRARLEDILRQTSRMREIIDHFRVFARTDDASDDSFAVADAIDGALAIVRGTLAASGVRVEIDVGPDLPSVQGRLVPFEQVIVNLLVNARDAMAGVPSERRRAEIVARYLPERGHVAITVRDTGPGVPEGLLHRVFEPFFTTKPPGEGTGLGLAITYGIVRGANGTVEMANHPEGGALVTLILRPSPQEAPTPAPG